ncbi:hypothetical protein C8R43DRAFT_1139608 [Mycena crocata]|nr:hypothetical protein C8R43DRAFT_1139608 [Mycena crocata]
MRTTLFFLGITVPALIAGAATSTSSAPWPTCTVAHTAGADDSPSIRAAIANCTNNATILFLPGVEYNSFTPVKFALGQDVTVQLLGNINLPSNIAEVQAGVTGKNYRSEWFSVTSTGPGVALLGPTTASARLKGGIFKALGSNLAAHAICHSNGTISGITISKPIGKSFNIAGNGNKVQDIIINAKSSSSTFPFNTDGFDGKSDVEQ